MKPSLLLLVVASFFASYTYAETLYIKDIVYVPMRSGPSSNHRILHKGLRSSTAVEFISTNEDKSWFEVKTEGGVLGWIPKQYLSQNPTAQLELNRVSKELKETAAQLKKLKTQFDQQNVTLTRIQSQLSTTEKDKSSTQTELARIRKISAGAVELDKNYRKLLEEHGILNTRYDTLTAENMRLKTDQRFSYMFYGAALIIFGMLMAVIIPRLKPKKRNSEWVS